MRWEKRGHIYSANNENNWAVSHASLPTPYLRNNGTLRIFVSFCDTNTVSRIGFVDIDSENPKKVLRVSQEPVLEIGEPGTFDDNGVVPISIVKNEEKLFLYYVGFQQGIKRRYYLFSGLAISEDDGETFTKYQKTPLLDRSETELFIRTAPFVIKERDKWKMWYLAGSEWKIDKGKEIPIYRMHYLESDNGIDWGKQGKLIIDICKGVHGYGRPFVRKEKNRYEMLLSPRFEEGGYRLSWAESKDGIDWKTASKKMNLQPSSEGWDSEMICYGTLFSRYLFYNGNDYGRTGFGYAELSL